MPLTLFHKIWQAHRIVDIDADTALVAIDRILLHERTGGVALRGLMASGRAVIEPAHVFVTMDHVVDTLPGRTDRTIMPTGHEFITITRAAAKAAGVRLFDIGDRRQGIVHVISPEQAIVLPGLTLVCPDSHTSTQGALGALAWGIGSTEAEHALATGTLRVKRPATMRINVRGRLAEGVTAKDLALHIVAALGSSGAKGRIVEFAGEAIEALAIEARMTLCNMAAELGAFSAIIAPDETTIAYLEGRPFAPRGSAWTQACAYWRTLMSDAGAHFDAEEHFDGSKVRPMLSWGTSPEQSLPAVATTPAPNDRDEGDGNARSRAYMSVAGATRLDDLAIDGAFIGSCTNSRLSDLRRVADVLRGRHVAEGVRAICVPGSGLVKETAEAEGIDRVLREAGFEWREPGCSMCFFAGGESFGEGQRVVSSTNRNFESRQGLRVRTHIASPETVAASAVLGRLGTVNDLTQVTEPVA